MPKPHYGRNPRRHTFKGKFQNSPREYHHQNQFKEVDVGITQFLSAHEGFSGIIKARFSDFQVNEIDCDGNIAKLTDTSMPADFNPKEEKLEPPLESPIPQIQQDVWEGIKNIVDKETLKIEIDATDLSKEDRTSIHEMLKRYFGRRIYCNTENTDEKKMMVFQKFAGKTDDTRNPWPKDKSEYVHFLVYKECIDTLDATLQLAKCLRMSASYFTYAGVKDKRAKTTQWFSVKRVEPWKLIRKTKCIRNVKVGNICFKDQPLKIGDLSGNKFRIALRNVTGENDLIAQSLESLKETGFINYYGLQRFGNDKEVPTFSIGLKLLLGNWKEACDIILKVTQSDQPDFDITKAKKVYTETGDAKEALKQFSENQKSCIEYLLLLGLSKENEDDYLNALASIPRYTRLLYIHSFQSLVWNILASKRIEEYGMTVVEGDLVLIANEESNDASTLENEDPEQNRPNVKALTSDDLPNYSIYDIVLPLPGFDITYPKNLEDFYKETLEQHGLTLEMTRHRVKEYSLSGTYRKLLRKVKDLSWRIMHYNDPNYNLIRSDFEELRKESEPKDIESGAYKALILEFSLSSSSYATMVLREILKTDTSSSAHAKLNKYHEESAVSKTIEENTDEVVSEKIDLLDDAQKFEAFKSLVFAEDETTLKRKHEEDLSEMGSKAAKIEK